MPARPSHGSYRIFWGYRTAPGREEDFRRVYGPDGDWARLFRRHPGFVATHLYESVTEPGRFCTIDFWRSRSDFEEFMRVHRAAYAELDRLSENLTTEEAPLGQDEA
ncbi:MAG: antibiotic biosynthesis monooxygenase [Gemmatimonadales bacterium]